LNVAQTMAACLKAEGVEYLFCYPTSHIIDAAAQAGIRPIVVRQERTGIHMADAIARMTGGAQVGVFAMQHGPGAENSYGGVAQAYAESVPVLIIAQGYPQRLCGIRPNFSAAASMRDVSKATEMLQLPGEIHNAMRRSFSLLRNGRGGPVVLEVPSDVWLADASKVGAYRPVSTARCAPAPQDVGRAAALIAAAKRPVIYAGQGIHYAQAWQELQTLAEQFNLPVATTLPGKSAFPEDHPLALGSGGLAWPLAVRKFLDASDLILALGTSLTETVFAVPLPTGKKLVHLTVDPNHLNKDVAADVGLLGDAQLGICALRQALTHLGVQAAREREELEREIAATKADWMRQWLPELQSNARPISPYRVIAELMKAVQTEDVVVTHDAGRPRDQLTPFWIARKPLGFIGWGKTTQLGYGLPLAMGAKLACPQKVCINLWGDAAIGFTGTDLETSVRERIPVLSILLNNGGMATELRNIPKAIERYGAARITGHYADMAKALGCYSERIEDPAQVFAAIQRGIQKTKEGHTVLLECMTAQETRFSQP